MGTYLISYDLLKEGQDYDSLYKAIQSYDHWARVNESVWIVVTDHTAVQIRDNLSQVLDNNDRLFVLKSGTEAAWRNARCKNEWLKKYL